ncbi:MAG: hypothetical protein N2Z20_00885 [Elusimicrobiales bacterium]|nr:hypothetical protein [Elusimicrobiales bacterium]
MINLNKKIEEIIKRGLIKASNRLQRITSVNWTISEVKVGPIKIDDEDCICVYLKSETEFSCVLTVSEKDAGKIMKYFITSYLPQFNTLEIMEFFVNELGNIILNSSLSEFANELKIKIIPHPPNTIKGKKSFIIENILSMIETSNHAVISSRIKLIIENTIVIDVYYFISKNFIERIL